MGSGGGFRAMVGLSGAIKYISKSELMLIGFYK
jgi:hypothetical protein